MQCMSQQASTAPAADPPAETFRVADLVLERRVELQPKPELEVSRITRSQAMLAD